MVHSEAHSGALRTLAISSMVESTCFSLALAFDPTYSPRNEALLNTVPILLYHAVTTDPPNWIAPFTVSPATFSTHLDIVIASGRQPLTVSEYVDGLCGTIALPPQPVLITVDDGFADFADNALPELAERKLPSTLYITTGTLAGRENKCVLPVADMLDGADLPALEAAGVEIGAHSHTHRQLDLLPKNAVAVELSLSSALLAEALGHPIRSFAYPHGYWSASVRRLVAQAGFDSACAVGETLSSPKDHPLALPRLMVRANTDVSTIKAWMDTPESLTASRLRRVMACGWRQYRRIQHRRRMVTRRSDSL